MIAEKSRLHSLTLASWLDRKRSANGLGGSWHRLKPEVSAHLRSAPYFPERSDSAVFWASARFGDSRATRSKIALASSERPCCCKARASSKYPTSVDCTTIAPEYWRTASG